MPSTDIERLVRLPSVLPSATQSHPEKAVAWLLRSQLWAPSQRLPATSPRIVCYQGEGWAPTCKQVLRVHASRSTAIAMAGERPSTISCRGDRRRYFLLTDFRTISTPCSARPRSRSVGVRSTIPGRIGRYLADEPRSFGDRTRRPSTDDDATHHLQRATIHRYSHTHMRAARLNFPESSGRFASSLVNPHRSCAVPTSCFLPIPRAQSGRGARSISGICRRVLARARWRDSNAPILT